MGSEWITTTLGEVTNWSSGGTPKKSDDSFWNGNIPWISASSMEGHLYSSSKHKITYDGLKDGSRLAPKDSILLLVRGSILHQKIQVGLAASDLAFNQDVKCLIPKKEYIEPWYLLLWFKANETKLLSMVENTGIGAGKLDTKLLQSMSLEIPQFVERQRILYFGKALLDKITLNRQINQTLEQMAQALFKSWFVDFDPVIDNALDAGNPIPDALAERSARRQAARASDDFQPLPDDVRQLFPNEFEESELGWIPKGWEIEELNKFARLDTTSIKPFSAPEMVWEHYSIPAFDTDQLPRLDTGESIKSGKYQVKNGAVLVSKLNPETKRIWFPNISHNKTAICSTEFMQFVPTGLSSSEFLYGLFHTDKFYNGVINTVTGTTGSRQRAQPKQVSKMNLLFPTNELMSLYMKNVSPYLLKIQCNKIASLDLAKTRDTLLPKLISGELRLDSPEVKKATSLLDAE